MRMKITEDFTPGSFEVTGFNDENGQPFVITDATKDNIPSRLQVIVESTHTGINRNKVEYTFNGLENSVSSWTDNYNKPVLLNHNPYSDNIGRVKHAEFCQSVIDPSKHCIKLTLEITNKDAIERFLDGRYKTFSIGGYTDSAKCSICGKDQMTDGWCGHQRGRKYDGKEAYWTLGKMEYDEISVVNCPADVHAQAIDIKVITNEPQADSAEQQQTDDVQNPDSITDSILDGIDTLLGKGQEQSEPQTDSTDEAEQGEEASTGENIGSQEDGNVKNDNINDELEQLKAQLAEKDNRIAELEQAKEQDEAIITELNEKLQAADSAKAEMESELQLVKDEKKALLDQNVEFAKFSHRVLCEKVADMQILAGEKQADEREALLTDYAVMTSKALKDMSQEILNRPHQKDNVRGTVTNPVPVSDGDTEETPSGKNKQKDLASFEDAFANFFRTRM